MRKTTAILLMVCAFSTAAVTSWTLAERKWRTQLMLVHLNSVHTLAELERGDTEKVRDILQSRCDSGARHLLGLRRKLWMYPKLKKTAELNLLRFADMRAELDWKDKTFTFVPPRRAYDVYTNELADTIALLRDTPLYVEYTNAQAIVDAHIKKRQADSNKMPGHVP